MSNYASSDIDKNGLKKFDLEYKNTDKNLQTCFD